MPAKNEASSGLCEGSTSVFVSDPAVGDKPAGTSSSEFPVLQADNKITPDAIIKTAMACIGSSFEDIRGKLIQVRCAENAMRRGSRRSIPMRIHLPIAAISSQVSLLVVEN